MTNEIKEKPIETALQTAEDAITAALSENGTRTWGVTDALEAVSLLVTRFAVGISVNMEGGERSPATDLQHSVDFVDMVATVAKQGCHSVFESDVH